MVSLIGEKIHTKKTPQGNFLAESSALDFFSTFFFAWRKSITVWRDGNWVALKMKKKKNYATNGLCSIKKKLCGYVVLRVVVWVKSLRMCLWARKKNVRNSSMTHTNVQQRCNSDVREHMSVRLATTCAPFLRLSISNWFFFFFSLTIDAIFYFYLRWLQTYRQIVSVVKASCLLFLFADLVFFFICNIWHKCNAKCYTEGKFFEFNFENSSQCIFFSISTSAFDFNSSCSSIHSSSLLWCDINNDDDDDDDWIWEWIVVWETKMEVEIVILIITK